jgi:hypothetical protein
MHAHPCAHTRANVRALRCGCNTGGLTGSRSDRTRWSWHTHTNTRTHANTHAHTHAHTHARTHTHQYMHTHRRTVARAHLLTRTHACTLARTHTHAHTHARAHAHTHAGARTHAQILPYRDQWICFKDFPAKATVIQVGTRGSLNKPRPPLVLRCPFYVQLPCFVLAPVT